MICKCNTNMTILTDEYDGIKNRISIYYYCNKCGRVYYKDLSKEEESYWLEPNICNNNQM